MREIMALVDYITDGQKQILTTYEQAEPNHPMKTTTKSMCEISFNLWMDCLFVRTYQYPRITHTTIIHVYLIQ